MIRTEIDITNPQKVEVIETGEIGWIVYLDEDNYYYVVDKNGEEIGQFRLKQLRPIEDRLVFNVSSFDNNRLDMLGCMSFNVLYSSHKEDLGLENYTFQVIATPKIEDSEAKKFLEDFDPQIKEVGYDNYSYTPEQVIERLEAFKKLLNN